MKMVMTVDLGELDIVKVIFTEVDYTLADTQEVMGSLVNESYGRQYGRHHLPNVFAGKVSQKVFIVRFNVRDNAREIQSKLDQFNLRGANTWEMYALSRGGDYFPDEKVWGLGSYYGDAGYDPMTPVIIANVDGSNRTDTFCRNCHWRGEDKSREPKSRLCACVPKFSSEIEL